MTFALRSLLSVPAPGALSFRIIYLFLISGEFAAIRVSSMVIASARVYHPGGLTLMGFLLSLLVYVVLLRQARVVPLAERRPLVGLRSRTISVVHHHPSAKVLVDAADHRPTAETKTLAKGNPTTKAIVASHSPTAQTLFSSHHESKAPTHKPPNSVPGMSTSNQSSGAFVLDGRKWLRFGAPWQHLDFKLLRLSVQCSSPVGQARFVMFAQDLSGVFDKSRRYYVAVWISSSGRLKGQLLKRSGGQSIRRHVQADAENVCNGAFWTVTVGLTASLELSLTASMSHTVPNGHTQPDDNEKFLRHPGLSVDSGIYISAVQDCQYAVDIIENMTAAQNFVGNISRHLGINDVTVDALSSQLQTGTVNEWIGRRLLAEINLAKSLSSVSPMVDVDLQKPAVHRFPIIGAVSDNHKTEMLGMIATAQKKMPLRGILLYDLGLTNSSIKQLNDLCNVTVRHYRRNLYQDLVSNLRHYRFKPLLIFSAMAEFGGAIYVDASIRFNGMFRNIPLFRHGHGFVGFIEGSRAHIHSFTHDGMLRYFNVTRKQVTDVTLAIGGLSIWLGESPVAQLILHNWFLCILDVKCIAPPGSVLGPCNWTLSHMPGRFVGCHRYDQSALSVVLLKMFGEKLAKSTILEPAVARKFVYVHRVREPNATVCRLTDGSNEPTSTYQENRL